MRAATYDIESDGLLDSITKIHCLAIRNCATGESKLYTADSIPEGLALLDTAEIIYGHNVVGFDNLALEKLYGWVPKARVRDTMLWSQFLFSDLKANDARMYGDDEDYEIALGSHSLENWGKRLGCLKSDYQGGWDEANEELFAYCLNDVAVTERLRRHLQDQDRTNEIALELEHHFARIVARMELRGVFFDIETATELHASLQESLVRLEEDITADIPPTVSDMKTPEYYTVV